MKKWFVFIILIVFFAKFALSFDPSNQSAVNDLQNNVERVQEIQGKVGQLQNLTFLESQWRDFLLKNKFISFVDSAFNKISFLFLILFAKSYSMSFVLLGIIFLWFFIFFNGVKIIKSWGIVGRGAFPYVASLVATVALAWLNLLNNFVVLLSKLIYSPDYWLIKIVSILLILFGFFIVEYLSLLTSKLLKDRDKTIKEKATDLAQKKIQKFADKMSKGEQQ